ncbi:DUF1642 domain-containing protein [Streptococcus mitis]|uniref:DUF1642 domain-containing protein n=1 Tax=Streptococcus mitis TaxID=28037 RepID=UPI0021B7CB1C|nr:DUF1642 domain-containing protein [Streptococcus mitis]
MNKQDALKQIEEQRDMILELHGWGVFGYIKGIINQLDEPQKIELPKVDFKKSQKVKVLQFVADWYEKNKDSFEFNVLDWIAFRDEAKKIENREFNNWINDSRENPIQTLVNMHQFGYEIEKEKQYLVKIKATKHYLVKDGNGKIFFSLTFKGYFTKKELEEAGFGWVFDCPGIEIEEVEV